MIQKITVRHAITASLASFAINNPDVAKILRYVGNDAYTWVGLYRILDAIKGDSNGWNELVKKGLITGPMLKAFKHTANSPSAAGDYARHGAEPTQPPREAMQLKQAQAVVQQVVVKWLELRYGQAI